MTEERTHDAAASVFRIVGCVGAVLMFGGPVGTWGTVVVGGVNYVVDSGLDVTVAFAIGAVVTCLAVLRIAWSVRDGLILWLQLALAAFMATVVGFDMASIAQSSTAYVGGGMQTVLLGAVLVIAGSIPAMTASFRSIRPRRGPVRSRSEGAVGAP